MVKEMSLLEKGGSVHDCNRRLTSKEGCWVETTYEIYR